MIQANFALAFSAGLVAAINPCGFALLPSYLAYVLGLDGPEPAQRSAFSTAARAIGVGVSMTAGFMVVFAIIGLLWSSISSVIKSNLSWASIIVGIGILILGIAMLFGFEPSVKLPHLELGDGGRQFTSVFLYGVSYAVTSLSCTMPIFAGTLTQTLESANWLSAFLVVLTYSLGMGLLITALTVAVAFARKGLVSRIRGLLPIVNKISGVLLVLAGLFVIWYGWAEVQVLSNKSDGSGMFSTVTEWQGRIQNWVSTNQSTVVIVSVAVVAGAIAAITIAKLARRQRSPQQ